MPSLKELRSRKKSVQATQKITSAMKLIAAAKLRRAQAQVEAARPYARFMSQMLQDLGTNSFPASIAPKLMDSGRPLKNHLFIVVTSNRGLCGGFNASIVRYGRGLVQTAKDQDQIPLLLCVGRKGFDALKRNKGVEILETLNAFDKPLYIHAQLIASKVLTLFEKSAIDGCTLVYNKFISALTQQVTHRSLIPYTPIGEKAAEESVAISAPYDYEPNQGEVVEELLKQNLSVQIFRALLENAASEQGARMAAMDGATRNAQDMIQALNLTYNRTRQAFITKELIEIISGAEAL